jgi:two-component system, NarL family, sensor histidine kinase UhpB
LGPVTLLTRVLLVNAAVVVFGAIAGTAATVRLAQTEIGSNRPTLVILFAAIGIVLSVSLNYLVLRAAFRPLALLERTAEAVRRGDLTARVEPLPESDPQMARLGLTFNRTLDQLAEDRKALHRVASQVISAQEEERKRISRELHDDTAQVLFAGLLRAAAFKQSSIPEIREAAAALEEATVDALEGVRRLALELRPPALDDLGLVAALEDLAQRYGEQFGMPVAVEARGGRGRLPGAVELVLYRVAQEALTNSAKHAGASSITIDLDQGPSEVTLSVRDDGKGFDPAQVRGVDADGAGLGLFGMAERVGLVGGGLLIWSAPGSGCEIFAWAPIGTGVGRQMGSVA